MLQTVFPSPELQLVAIYTIQVTHHIKTFQQTKKKFLAILSLLIRRFATRLTSHEGFWFAGLSPSTSTTSWKKR